MATSMSPKDAQSVTVLVCEEQSRWSNMVKRFLGPDRNDTSAARVHSRPIRVQRTEPSQVRSLIAGATDTAVLWEVDLVNASSIALTIAQIGVGRSDVLQLAALQGSNVNQRRRLALRLREIGVAATFESPDEFPAIARLIRRRFGLEETLGS